MSEDHRIGLGILFGGPSGEHEVSIMSARAIWDALDRSRYRIHALGIARDGTWCSVEDPIPIFDEGRMENALDYPAVNMVPGPGGGLYRGRDKIALDVVFPVLHGPFGEDGSVQGVLEILGVPYVGAGVASSGASMDKHLMKRLFSAAGLPVVDHLCFSSACLWESVDTVTRSVSECLGYPCFVKPAALGSSLGISRVTGPAGLPGALREAGALGDKVLVERGVQARELECSVLGNCHPEVAGPGEILPAGEFYDYDSKYFDDRTRLIIPAPVDDGVAERARRLSLEAFQAVDARGMARVDLFYCPGDGRLLVNEINTIPGFTSMSMYPRLWKASGMDFGRLVDRLVDLALE